MDHKSSSRKTENGPEKLDCHVGFRVTARQLQAIEERAKEVKRKRGDFMRLVVMNDVGDPDLMH